MWNWYGMGQSAMAIPRSLMNCRRRVCVWEGQSRSSPLADMWIAPRALSTSLSSTSPAWYLAMTWSASTSWEATVVEAAVAGPLSEIS